MPLLVLDPILHLQQQDYPDSTTTQQRNISSMQNMYFNTLKAQKNSRSNMMVVQMPDITLHICYTVLVNIFRSFSNSFQICLQ